MVDYRKTGKYVQTPPQDPTDIYVGKPEEVDYSGKSTRIDDNFTYIASQIGGPEKYHPGTGLSLDTQSNTFSVNSSYVDTLIAAAIVDKQDTLVPGANISIDENNVISIYGISQYQEATTEDAGLMSAEDKEKLDSIAENANNYVLTPATQETLGGIIVGDNLTIDNNGVLDAIDTTYDVAIASVNGAGGSAGLLSATDKEKLDTVTVGANRVTSGGTNGYLVIDNTAVEVYRHPSYTARGGTIDSGKLINGITVDELGHVTGYSTTNESGINVSIVNTGNVLIDATYTALTRTLSIDSSYLGSIQIGVLDSSATGVNPSVTDSLNTVLQKIRNSIEIVNNSLSDDISYKLQFKGNIDSLPNNATNGDLYKVVSSFDVGADTVVNGDILIYNNSSWVKIPSGEKADTWRPVYVEDTQVLDSTYNGGAIKFKGTGRTNLIWDSSNNTLNIQTLGGSGGTGNTEYIAGTGISSTTVSSEDAETHEVSYQTTFDLDIASDVSLGGVKVGSGLSIDPSTGILSATATTYTANNGIQIDSNDVIKPVYGTTAGTVAEGNHAHDLDSIIDVGLTAINQGDVLTYRNGAWTNEQPTIISYTAGANVTILGTTISAEDTWRPLAIGGLSIDPGDAINIVAGDGIEFRTTNVDSLTTLTIVNSGGSGGGGGGTTYTATAPINIVDGDIRLNHDTGTLGVNSSFQLYVKPIDYSSNMITNKPSIPTVTWRPIKVNGDQKLANNDSSAIDFINGTNTTVEYNATNKTIKINASGGGGTSDVDVLSDLSDVEYVGSTTPAVPSNNQILKYNGSTGKWYNATDDNTTYAAGAGIAVNSNVISVNRATNSGLKLVSDSNVDKLAVDIDNSTIVIENGHLKVDHAEQTSGYVQISETAIVCTGSTSTGAIIMQNNTIYKCSNAVSSVNLTTGGLASGFQYATLCFITDSNISWTCNFRCVGFDCAYNSATGQSEFTPLANTEYQIAIDKIDTVVTGYVLRI